MRKAISIAAIAGLLVCVAFTQKRLTAFKDASWRQESMSFLPQSDKIAPYLLGFTTTYAAYLWIRTILYFGGHSIGDQQYRWLATMTDMVTRLNSRFYPAYEFAGLMLPDHGEDPASARVILERGVARFGASNWKLPFYLGYLYDKHIDNKAMAAFWMERAAASRGAPRSTKAIAALYHSQAGNTAMAKYLLASLYEMTESPQVREYLRRKIEALEGESGSSQRSRSNLESGAKSKVPHPAER